MIRVRHICIRHADELSSCVKSKLLKERLCANTILPWESKQHRRHDWRIMWKL